MNNDYQTANLNVKPSTDPNTAVFESNGITVGQDQEIQIKRTKNCWLKDFSFCLLPCLFLSSSLSSLFFSFMFFVCSLVFVALFCIFVVH